MIKFLTIDPSFANLGIVKGYIDSDLKVTLDSYKLVQTEKTKVKSVRSSSDTVERCTYLKEGLLNEISEWEPQVCFAETPSGSQSYSGALSYGISCFLIAMCNPPAIQVTPIETKKLTVGSKTATKKEIIEYVNNLYPSFLETKKDGSVVEGRMEHIADAVCITLAGIKVPEFKQLKKLLENK